MVAVYQPDIEHNRNGTFERCLNGVTGDSDSFVDKASTILTQVPRLVTHITGFDSSSRWCKDPCQEKGNPRKQAEAAAAEPAKLLEGCRRRRFVVLDVEDL